MYVLGRLVNAVPIKVLLIWACLVCCGKDGTTGINTITYTPPDSLSSTIDTTARSWLALGDSYTIGSSVAVSERYPEQTALALRGMGVAMQDPDIIATSGWTTDNLLQAIRYKTAPPFYNIVTLLIGVNNQYQGRSMEEYRTQFTTLVEKAIAFAGGKHGHVIVLSIPDYSVTPFVRPEDKQRVSQQIDAFNTINRQVSDRYKVLYVDITEASREAAVNPSLVAADSLHFSGAAYKIWAGLLAPVIRQALQ
jgi:lysophospholipase L1-like esterase